LSLLGTSWAAGGAVALIVSATLAGCALASRIRWAEGSAAAGIPLAAGLALAPLLAGLAAVAALWLWPGVDPRMHLLLVIAGLAALAMVRPAAAWAQWSQQAASAPTGQAPFRSPGLWLVAGFSAVLVVDGATVPLIQNDALEYATAARVLFDSGDGASYPVLSADAHRSGFYGPWTHPPLYVSLLYLGFALQGQAQDTLMLRLFSPWCLMGSVACVAALGRWMRPGAGALAGALLVSTPLLFLGAASALIDALPVLGFALALVCVAAGAGGLWQRAGAAGAGLGLALWTHSQAVLFPLLLLPVWAWSLLRAGFKVQAMAAGAVVAALVALSLSVWPYLRNLRQFGSPISDNPVVFALPSLDWPEYFRVQRGLGSVAELVQYGLLKPWFAVEAYSVLFWLALPAALALAWRARTAGGMARLALASPQGDLAARARVAEFCALVMALYLVGTVLSVAVGVDLMVRNERYMLVLVPCAAVLAAGWLTAARQAARRWVVGFLALQLLALGAYRVSQLSASASGGSSALARWPPHGAVGFLARETPADALVLSLKPADMFYSQRTMRSYLDTRLLPFYAERDADAAAARLRDLEVAWVHMPDYWLPPVYNSALMALLADPALAELRFDRHGYQVFSLREPGAAPSLQPCAAATALTGWQRQRQFVFGGRKNLLRVALGGGALAEGAASRSWNPTPLFQRETLTALELDAAVAAIPRQREWLVEVELKGEGYVQLQLRVHDAAGKVLETRLLGDRPLSALGGPVRLARRVVMQPGTSRLQLRLEHRAASWLRPVAARLTPLCGRGEG
jgi:4-amino-4-deoxy-L-arabinose transferase-like glycosyltransferase